MVQKVSQEELIEPGSTLCASPIVFASKKNSSLRFCDAYRKLDAVTVRGTNIVPRTSERIDSSGETWIFSTLHAIQDSGKPKLMSVTDQKCRSRIITDLSNFFRCSLACKTHRRYSSEQWQLALVYLKNIVVSLTNVYDHMSHLRHVLTLPRSTEVPPLFYELFLYCREDQSLRSSNPTGTSGTM